MKKLLTIITISAMALVGAVGAAAAGNHDDDHAGHDYVEHPHLMLHNVKFVELPNGDRVPDLGSADRCIDLAANRSLRLTAHHHSVHQGTAGVGEPTDDGDVDPEAAKRGFTRNLFFEEFTQDKDATPSGHMVIPAAPFPFGDDAPTVPWDSCKGLGYTS